MVVEELYPGNNAVAGTLLLAPYQVMADSLCQQDQVFSVRYN